jgi:hypothetical protein
MIGRHGFAGSSLPLICNPSFSFMGKGWEKTTKLGCEKYSSAVAYSAPLELL